MYGENFLRTYLYEKNYPKAYKLLLLQSFIEQIEYLFKKEL